MGIDEQLNTSQTLNWQRDVSSFLSSLTEFVNAFDVDKLSNEEKTKALKSLQKLVSPSAPATDGGVAKMLRSVLAETKRMNNISFAGGHVVNNVMGIGLFLDPDDNENSGKPFGQILLPPLYLDPNPHSHTTSSLSHGEPYIERDELNHAHTMDHDHTASATGTHTHNLATHLHTLSAHVHSLMNHTHQYDKYEDYGTPTPTSGPSVSDTGVPDKDITGIPAPDVSEINNAYPTITVDSYSGSTTMSNLASPVVEGLSDHAAGNTGDTDLDVALVSP